nr:uncharacterized protein LOC114821821 isoform X1 [Malus domestica]
MKSSASKASSSSSNSMRSSNSSREKMNSSSTSTPSQVSCQTQGIVGESTLPQLPMVATQHTSLTHSDQKWQGEAQRKVLCCLLGRLCVELELEDLKILFVQDMK